MPTWSGILEEIIKTGNPPRFDDVRRKYLAALQKHTGRNVILYATRCTQPEYAGPPNLISIVDEDVQGMMEVVHGLKGDALDLILHSPGGVPEATESLVEYLRSKFKHIRVIVPQIAMSAATMLACAADVVVMGKHSFLSPIDPQLFIATPLGPRIAPAQAVIEQFQRAQEECADPAKLAAWTPMLAQYGPELLVQCERICEMSRELVRDWLQKYMLKDSPKAAAKARDIADWLSDHKLFKTHARHIPRHVLEEKGLKIERLEKDETLQDLVLSAFHAVTHTFSGIPAVKIIENHEGKAFIKIMQMAMLPVQPGSPPPGFQPFPPPTPGQI